MLNLLKGKKLWIYVASEIDLHDAKDTKYEEWESDVGKINSWIANSVIPSLATS